MTRWIMGAKGGRPGVVEIFAQNTKTLDRSIVTLIHESSHANVAGKGGRIGTLLDEYKAYRREDLFRNGGQKLSNDQKIKAFQDALNDYYEPGFNVGGDVPSLLKGTFDDFVRNYK